jgi:hypothetical protein
MRVRSEAGVSSTIGNKHRSLDQPGVRVLTRMLCAEFSMAATNLTLWRRWAMRLKERVRFVWALYPVLYPASFKMRPKESI